MMILARQPSVLVAEADAVVAVDLSDALQRGGYRVIGPVDTAAEAARRLARETPTLAVIDLELKDGLCTDLVRDLRRCGARFLVHSRCLWNERLDGEVDGAPWLVKPAMADDVVAVLDELSPSAGPA